MTNAERIRRMTEEELAEFLCDRCPPIYKPSDKFDCIHRHVMRFNGCEECWLHFLRDDELFIIEHKASCFNCKYHYYPDCYLHCCYWGVQSDESPCEKYEEES